MLKTDSKAGTLSSVKSQTWVDPEERRGLGEGSLEITSGIGFHRNEQIGSTLENFGFLWNRQLDHFSVK